MHTVTGERRLTELMHQHSGPATVQLVPDDRSDEEGEAVAPLPGFVPQPVYKCIHVPPTRAAHKTDAPRCAASYLALLLWLPSPQYPSPPTPTLLVTTEIWWRIAAGGRPLLSRALASAFLITPSGGDRPPRGAYGLEASCSRA